DARSILRIIAIRDKALLARLISIKSSDRPYPEPASTVFINIPNNVMADAMGVGRIIAVNYESIALLIIPIQSTLLSSNPEDSLAIFVDRPDRVAANTIWISSVMAIDSEGVSDWVIPV